MRIVPVSASVAGFIFGLVLPAHAEITINRAEYKAGVLVVRGETSERGQRVTLDGRYSARTDRNNRFRFRVRYLPRDCIAKIRAGQEVHPAVISNCNPTGATSVNPGRTTSAVGKAESQRSDAEIKGFIRVVRQPCETGQECRVVCREREIALNAYCPDGRATLISEQAVSCGTAARDIVAYCASAP